MKNRNKRLETLRLILLSSESSSQEELRRELAANGFSVTQATLSRDLHKLKAAKVAGPMGFRYILSDSPAYRRKVSPAIVPESLRNTGFVNIKFSGNLVVIHTRPGYAASIAIDIDSHRMPAICGTIAGDDTVIAVMTEGATRQEATDELSEVLPAIKSLVL